MFFPYPTTNNLNTRYGNGHHYKNPKAVAWSYQAGLIAKTSINHAPLDCELCVILILHPKMNKDGTASKARMDIDGMSKVVLDAMKGIIYLDDKQVVPEVLDIGPPIKGGGVTLLYSKTDKESLECLITTWLKERQR